ncbi:NnrU family protein [Aliiroseovarius sp. CAU 1755]
MIILCAWLFFGGAHVALSSTRLRQVLLERIGARGFVIIYTLLALLGLTALFVTTWVYGASGAPGFGLGAIAPARFVFGLFAFLGVVMLLSGLQVYFRSPIVALRLRSRRQQEPVRPPAGIETITRHPFFVGTALFAAAHVFLASTLAMGVFFGGFVVLTLAGSALQDHRLRTRYGQIYADYQSKTTVLPRARRVPSRDGLRGVSGYLPTFFGAGVLLAMHPLLKLGNGAMFIAMIAAFGLFAVTRVVRRGRVAKMEPK